MDICIVGAGYVGLTTAGLLADLGHNIHCIDKDVKKIENLNKGKSPIHEPGLEELLNKNHQNGRLIFSDDREACFLNAPILLIAVGTPSRTSGEADLFAIKKVFEHIASKITSYKLIITKSTVPPGSNEWFHQYLLDCGVDEKLFDIVSNPEFLREGSAVHDSFHPDKIVIGSKSVKAIQVLKAIYEKLNAPFVETSLTGAEMMKYASNAFLATKISFINEFARICDQYDVDITEVATSIGFDPRIGPHFLQSGLGYGGSCFPKDLDALSYAARKKKIKTNLLDAVKKVNDHQVDYYVNKLELEINGLKGKQITIWGLAFKPNTDDVRESRSIKLCEKLIQKGCTVIAFDPKAKKKPLFIEVAANMYQAAKHSDALIVATDWDLFLSADWSQVKEYMKGRTILDGRNYLDPEEIRAAGLSYLGVGRP
ncbi:UDP-glucose/GDP-mannose dehydrogenase family protein [Pseudalkalibacillus hwajinpoensis]|uniref:UDP-glucose dehydrogenase family protein n=1 Tax=Guptibacillus hwajinpoensis TaxID=208199 RepID=UPI00325A7B21